MTRFYLWVKIFAVTSLIPVAVCAAFFLWSLKQTSDQIRDTTATLPKMVDTVRVDLLNKIDDVQAGLSKDLRHVAAVADRRAEKLTTVTDKRLAAIQGDVIGQVIDLRRDLDKQLTTANTSVATVTTAYALIPSTVGFRLNKYTDCENNDLCWQGQISDTMFAIRTAGRDVSKTMAGVNRTLPVIQKDLTTMSGAFAQDIPKITANFNDITANINRLTKPKWYDRLLGYGMNGLIMYRQFNPGLNITTAATAAISK